jgi:hypothetical protein
MSSTKIAPQNTQFTSSTKYYLPVSDQHFFYNQLFASSTKINKNSLFCAARGSYILMPLSLDSGIFDE